jgi:hypothetical protein
MTTSDIIAHQPLENIDRRRKDNAALVSSSAIVFSHDFLPRVVIIHLENDVY